MLCDWLITVLLSVISLSTRFRESHHSSSQIVKTLIFVKNTIWLVSVFSYVITGHLVFKHVHFSIIPQCLPDSFCHLATHPYALPLVLFCGVGSSDQIKVGNRHNCRVCRFLKAIHLKLAWKILLIINLLQVIKKSSRRLHLYIFIIR